MDLNTMRQKEVGFDRRKSEDKSKTLVHNNRPQILRDISIQDVVGKSTE